MFVRVVQSSDAPFISEIYNYYVRNSTATFDVNEVTKVEMQRHIENIISEYPYFVCEDRGNIVGFCYAHLWKSRLAYSSTLETTIYISPQYRGKEVGSLLMNHLIEKCRERNVMALIACITGDNVGSLHFHQKIGFSQVSHFRKVGYKFKKWLDIIDMELLLQ